MEKQKHLVDVILIDRNIGSTNFAIHILYIINILIWLIHGLHFNIFLLTMTKNIEPEPLILMCIMLKEMRTFFLQVYF